MRRILLLITDLKIGGMPTIVRGLAIHMARWPDAQVQVACLAEWGPVADQIREAGIAVTALGARGVRDVGVVRRLIRLIREQTIDTVLSFLVHANAVSAVASWFCREVRLFQGFQTTQPRPRWHWPVQGLVARAAERMAVPSESVASALVERSGVARGRIVIIPNAVDVAEFAGLGRPAIQGPFPIGFIGRLDPVKRIDDLLEAVAMLRGAVHLHIFGDGEQRRHLEQMIARLEIAGSVTMHGTIPRPHEALARIGLLVLPSQAEGFPMVLIEAMAGGVPIVASNAPGIRDVITDGQTGVLAPVGDVPKLAEAIGRVVADEQLRVRLAEQARAVVGERYSWEKVMAGYRQLLMGDALG